VLCSLTADFNREKKYFSISATVYYCPLGCVSLLYDIRVPKETAYFTCRVACTLKMEKGWPVRNFGEH
jgi:hypothetical protein